MLESLNLRPVSDLEPYGDIRPQGWIHGKGTQPFEVVVATCSRQPTKESMRHIWKKWNDGRATPCLLVVEHGDKAAIFGTTSTNQQYLPDLRIQTAESLIKEILEAPSQHDALRRFIDNVPDLERPIPGLKNQYLLAWNELERGVPERPDWNKSLDKGRQVINERDRELLKGLGYELRESRDRHIFLYAKSNKTALALLLDATETFDNAGQDSLFSPVSKALRLADEERLPYVILIKDNTIRLYVTDEKIGVGRRGRSETFIQINLNMLDKKDAGYLWLLMSAESLADGKFIEIYESSKNFASVLGNRLRERVYREAVPALAKAVADEFSKNRDPKHIYSVALTILFRLLLIAYAEDKYLLPVDNERYKQRSLKSKAKEILGLINENTEFDRTDNHWQEIKGLFKAVDKGSEEWGVPEYNGGLFSADAEISKEGPDISALNLTNDKFGPVLKHLLLDKSDDGTIGPVDFRSLSIREFGTIYEGLLESELSIAATDLATEKDKSGNIVYRPAKEKDKVEVQKGEYYLHNKSGARKETGSYYTPQFAVDHLLDHALDPAIAEHLARLDELPAEEADKAFFDFKVADIAMGSGHFLVSAIDRIEREFGNYLEKNRDRLVGVRDELTRLKNTATNILNELGIPADEISESELLRRQIARRCIYGVDINPMAVKLAQVSIWIHTFVRGLPLSFLQYNLVCGNSLVGIGTMDEVEEMAKDLPLFIGSGLAEAKKPLEELKKLSDAVASEIKQAERLHKEAIKASEKSKQQLTIIAAARMDKDADMKANIVASINPKNPQFTPYWEKAKTAFTDLEPFHFPVAFPDVFSRERPGFDVILGNPPWEKVKIEEHGFWTRHFPGFRGLSPREAQKAQKKYIRDRPDLVSELTKERAITAALRQALVTGAYPGMGSGDPDLYKAFCWRFWHLVRAQGILGVVLPRSVFLVKGSTEFREEILSKAEVKDLTYLLNTAGWVFDDAEYRYTIVLSSIKKNGTSNESIPIRGPYRNRNRFLEMTSKDREPTKFGIEEVRSWTDISSLPLLPRDDSFAVFNKFTQFPRFDDTTESSWHAIPYAELHATADKPIMKFTSIDSELFWPIFKGESFYIWDNDRGIDSYYAWSNKEEIVPYLIEKTISRSATKKSAFNKLRELGVDFQDLGIHQFSRPRIAFRAVARATDSRTFIVALIPPNVSVTHQANVLLWIKGDELDQSYVLGIQSSLPFDWYARTFVELNVAYYFSNAFPIPRPTRDNPLWKRTVQLSGRLASPDERFAEWAKKVGVEWGALEPDEKNDMIYELDAVVSHLYGLEEKHVRHIFETFHEGWKYDERLDAVLKHYREWGKRMK